MAQRPLWHRGRHAGPAHLLPAARPRHHPHGDGDDEHPLARKRWKIQARITACVDRGIQQGLLQMHEKRVPTRGSPSSAMRRPVSPGCGGSTPITAPCWSPRSTLIRSACACAPCAVNPYLVLPATPDPWTRAPLPATCCVHAAAQSCDHTAAEVPGLILGTDLRFADVLTSALGNSYTALVISICTPHAQQAGPDCTQSRLQAKLAHCGPHLPSLLRQNISCTPIVFALSQ